MRAYPSIYLPAIVSSSRKEHAMSASTTLQHFLSHLSVAERLPLPEHEEWKDHVERISIPGRIAEISEEQYHYWLEVLPPKYMSRGVFAFAEGAEEIRLFWRASGRYFVRQLTWPETVTFCRLADIPLPH
jgi:hypothetical protein